MPVENKASGLAGLLYLVVVVTGLFSLAYVSSQITLSGDPRRNNSGRSNRATPGSASYPEARHRSTLAPRTPAKSPASSMSKKELSCECLLVMPQKTWH